MLHSDDDYFAPPVISPTIRSKRDVLRKAAISVRWCDDARLAQENARDVAPGGYLNRFGWYVVGTTIGGNGIVVAEKEERVCFVGHTWYDEERVCYQNLPHDQVWVELPMTAEVVAVSLFDLAPTVDAFVENSATIAIVLERVGYWPRPPFRRHDVCSFVLRRPGRRPCTDDVLSDVRNWLAMREPPTNHLRTTSGAPARRGLLGCGEHSYNSVAQPHLC